MINKNILPFLVIIIALFSHCGRKKKYPFSFKTKKKIPTVEKLDLPSIKGVRVEKEIKGNKIHWNPIEKSTLQELSRRDTVFVGYNIYRLTNYGFVPKTPLNKTPLSQTEYHDKQKREEKSSYVIRAIFRVNKKIIFGPLSRIVS